MVDLDLLTADDVRLLWDIVERHCEQTRSLVAARLLASWDDEARRFTKVMPKDYKRVLAAASAAARDGRDINEAVMAAAHG
jgi:glutamate synthase (NADPH/NADH) large chain